MSPRLRISHGIAVLGIACSFVGVLIGGQWMRAGTVIVGAALLPFGLLVLCDFGGEYTFVAKKLMSSSAPRFSEGRVKPSNVRYGFGSLLLLVGLVFLAAGILGGPGVTKPGLL
jgi:hypothetical protein